MLACESTTLRQKQLLMPARMQQCIQIIGHSFLRRSQRASSCLFKYDFVAAEALFFAELTL